jgi:glycosyltransferase involved in cell wall biosynthesis
MKATIIIPTYNREKILLKCLNSLKKQTIKDFEVIVVDDGSTDDTKKSILKESQKRDLNIKYIYQNHKQQGAARNKGMALVSGEYIFFIGDDILPEKNWLEEHLRIHKKEQNCAVLGLTLWHPNLKINSFMNYLAPNGPQFNYGKIKNRNNCGWDFFWTSNISVPRIFLKKEKFDENFRGWGYEDLELGYRLGNMGLRIIFNPKAIAYHYHYYGDPEEFLKKQEGAAKSALYFLSKYSELKGKLIEINRLKLLHRFLLLAYFIFPLLKKMPGFKQIYWKLKRRYYFERGLKNEKN